MRIDDHTPADAAARWARFQREAAELARAITERFASNVHHVIGTLRSDGAPRLSGTEVPIGATGVTVGMMADSRKLADVRRDPRVEIHSAPVEDDLAHGDARLSGRLVDTGEAIEGEPGAGHFTLLVERAVLIRVDGDHLVVATWDPIHGLRERRRR